MEGHIETNTITGIVENSANLVGTISNPDSLTAVLNPITQQMIRDYNKLNNKPQINEVELKDNKSLEDLHVNKLTNLEIEEIINSIV